MLAPAFIGIVLSIVPALLLAALPVPRGGATASAVTGAQPPRGALPVRWLAC